MTFFSTRAGKRAGAGSGGALPSCECWPCPVVNQATGHHQILVAGCDVRIFATAGVQVIDGFPRQRFSLRRGGPARFLQLQPSERACAPRGCESGTGYVGSTWRTRLSAPNGLVQLAGGSVFAFQVVPDHGIVGLSAARFSSASQAAACWPALESRCAACSSAILLAFAGVRQHCFMRLPLPHGHRCRFRSPIPAPQQQGHACERA